MKKLHFLFFSIIFCSLLKAQDASVTLINDIQNPQHKDNIGVFERGASISIKGSYTKETATSAKLRLLTFAKGTWTNALATYEVVIADAAPYSGIIDHTLTIPDDYILGVADGVDANTQMLQLRISYNGFADLVYNFNLSVVEKAPLHPTLIDFDAIYGSSSGSILVNNINTAISLAEPGDTILFKSASYDFEGKGFSLNKPITLSGALPTDIDKSKQGAYDVKTAFINMKGLSVNSDDVKLKNIKIKAIETLTNYVFNRVNFETNADGSVVFYTGIEVDNVIFEGGNLQLFGGIGAGITIENVSFTEYSSGGYFMNRRARLDAVPQSLIKKCYFKAKDDAINYNVRGLSFDAGNDDYPVTWDMSNMLIDSCFFENQGIAYSKCKNSTITNCHFTGYRKDVDMIHMEEFTNHIHIENNFFEFIKPSRCFYSEPGAQIISDITIINNKFKGAYFWVFWSNGVNNLRFENNDMTEASASNPSNKTFDFTSYHSEEIPSTPYPIENNIIRNNPGLSNSSIHGILSYRQLSDDNTNVMEGFSNTKTEKIILTERPKTIINVNTKYRIRNVASKETIAAQDEDSKATLINEERTDGSDVWNVEFRYPYTYVFINEKTKQCLEVYLVYTLGDIYKPDLDPIYLEQLSSYQDKEYKPHFMLRPIAGSNYFQIAPGGNEIKTRVIKDGTDVKLEPAKSSTGLFPNTEASTWELMDINRDVGISNIDNTSNFSLYPNPANDFVIITGKTNTLVNIIDVSGKTLLTKKMEGDIQNIDISSFSRGIYFVKTDDNILKMIIE